ncbi:MAG: glycosyltransferase family 4 protein [Pyrinomonadaceae bacterium]|nr:glycosyltransferase family 4 protein [Pyrinomonadaceae bacterium]
MGPALKILQISSAQSLGGGERHLVDLVEGLVERGHQVDLALRPNSPLIDELRSSGKKGLAKVKVTTLPLRNSLDAFSARALAKLVRQNQIQIVHAHMARDYPLAAYAVRGNKGARLIVTRHVLFPLSRLHRVTLAKAARIIAVSKAVATQVRADAVAAPERISVILNGIDASKFENASVRFHRERFLASWGLPENSLLIGTVGELTALKGHEEFLRAAAEVRKQFPRSHFVIAGTDSSRENKNRAFLEKLIKELELTDHVRLVGWVEDLPQLYCALDVFVSASHTESFGLAITEAMASGTAVVATETEGAREIIQPGETGLLVPVGDVAALATATTGLLEDESQRGRLGTAAQQAVAAQFSVERMVEETEEIYRAEIKSHLA